MAKLKSRELNDKTDGDLNKTLRELRESLRKFRFGASGSKVKNIKEARNLKRDIARVLTEQTRRQAEVNED